MRYIKPFKQESLTDFVADEFTAVFRKNPFAQSFEKLLVKS